MCEGVTIEDVVRARAAVESMSDEFDEKQNMLDRVHVISAMFEEDVLE